MRPHPPMPGEDVRERRLAEMIRVDHAGEYGAVQIYRGQRAVFGKSESKSHAARIIGEMEAGEAEHLKTFDRLIAERGVRPTLMAPIWRLAGFSLGAATALMGEQAAHACTEAASFRRIPSHSPRAAGSTSAASARSAATRSNRVRSVSRSQCIRHSSPSTTPAGTFSSPSSRWPRTRRRSTRIANRC